MVIGFKFTFPDPISHGGIGYTDTIGLIFDRYPVGKGRDFRCLQLIPERPNFSAQLGDLVSLDENHHSIRHRNPPRFAHAEHG